MAARALAPSRAHPAAFTLFPVPVAAPLRLLSTPARRARV